MPHKKVMSGISVVDSVVDAKELCIVEQSVSIFLVGWEARSFQVLKESSVAGRLAVLIRFEDDKIEDDVQFEFEKFAREKFGNVQVKVFCSARRVAELKGQLEDFVRELRLAELEQITVDYSSMPRMILQTLFRLFVTEGVSPRVNWVYSAGLYDGTEVVSKDFHQGIEGPLFSVHGGYGKAMSEHRVGIVALGADRELVSTFLRHENYEDVHYLYSPSESSLELRDKIALQRSWLYTEHGVSDSEMYQCGEHDVVTSLQVFSEIISGYADYPNASFDLFCAGPKTHSIAASALLSRYKNIRLLGRVPQRYSRMNIKPTGKCTITVVTDYTNVLAGRMLHNTSN